MSRFVGNPGHDIALGLLYFLPSECINVTDYGSLPNELAQVVELYRDDLPHSVMFSTEYSMWIRKWKQSTSELPNKLVDTLQACSALQFPTLRLMYGSFDSPNHFL